jgi:hypothetical protein
MEITMDQTVVGVVGLINTQDGGSCGLETHPEAVRWEFTAVV